VPPVSDMLLLRRLDRGGVNKAFLYFYHHILPCVAGLQKCRREGKLQRLGQIATPSDEALGLLLIENSEDRWLDEFEESKTRHGATSVSTPTMYTTSGTTNEYKAFTGKNCGWTVEGIERFNEILDMVKDDRKQNGKWFDDMWQLYLKKEEMERNDSNSRRKLLSPEEAKRKVLKAGNDLFDTDDEQPDDKAPSSDEDDEPKKHAARLI